MERRNFLQAAAATGLALSVPGATRSASAKGEYKGPFALFIHAGGGFDPIYLFDPTDNAEFKRGYTTNGKVGNISCATWTKDWERWNIDPNEAPYGDYIFSPEEFLQRKGNLLTVINGVNSTTNNHDSGRRTIVSGKLQEGYPAMGALMAAAKAADKPMSFISGGGYDFTASLVAPTRTGSIDSFNRIVEPNHLNPGDKDTDFYHTKATMDRIAKYQSERNASLRDAQKLPSIRRAIGELNLARVNDNELKNLKLPDELVELPGNALNDLERTLRQGQIIIEAMKTGVSVAGTVSVGGFDTHANHLSNQTRQLAKLLGAIDWIWDYAGQAGLQDQLTIFVTSDFGRGPHYNGPNDNDGKDHWPITSVLALGRGVKGNRMIGETTKEQLSRKVDPDSLDVDDKGVEITSVEVVKAMRKVVGVDDTDPAQQFPLSGEDLKLFG